ncbi:HsdR family type I site-specific deoxyribonuclease [Aureispira sp. CCB-E]|uniref:type I restriction endonuclease subunit R n=1 Tax=Aureispira sp. CCB-E TaxID=3051121 RepID=UPI002868479D|nr:HsdR family type I site-specific deoxyribonuclease [Aureispira sp. CCB-E]WMX15904.1 HsdR family type I site-specific deoxyribonuclease [Aureispira sp. CCB-E]
MSYSEFIDSQLPALKLLRKLNYQYLSPEQVDKQRGDLKSNVLLEDILAKQLEKMNAFEFRGKEYPFSKVNIQNAINELKNIPNEGLNTTNQKIFELLALGKSYEELVNGQKKSFTLQFIDWKNVHNNVFHMTEEMTVNGLKENRRPDLVLFVNGIPFVIIENKRRDKNHSIDEAISQHLRNQKEDIGIPKLFYYAQILLSVEPNHVKYATTGTPRKFWSVWKEEGLEAPVQKIINQSLNGIGAEDRLPTEQDRSLYAICQIERMMDLIRKFVVFDGKIKKIARYQQYFAIKATMQRIRAQETNGKRNGGVIWHTQGSGKSLTMVMLSKSIKLDESIRKSRIVVVTDRISLDKQIHKTFEQCGILSLKKAASGDDLGQAIENDSIEVITTITDKFDSALKKANYKNDSANIFVLIDESHRSQYGRNHARMKQMLPNACYLGFTGTPLMKKEKSTANKFGGFIHKYTIDQAVQDGAVLPLLYEGRSAKLSINKKQLDRGFDRVMESLPDYATEEDIAQFKKRNARVSKLYESQQVVEEIAEDISEHYCKNWQGGVFKAQLAVPKIETAIRYQKYFESQTNPKLKINTRVIFTPPDSRAGYEDVWQEADDASKRYWKGLMEKYGNQEAYEKDSIDKFKDEGIEVELLIVVSKLLTGFDAPRNTILYLAKPLSDHTLLQAIARVNRLFEGKEHGYIIDYVGILGKLDKALNQYSSFEGFDEKDLEGTLTNVLEEVRKIPQHHTNLWQVFEGVNQKDKEAMERYLFPQNIRDTFYKRLSVFARSLQAAFSTDEFYKEYDEAQIEKWRVDLKFFAKMKESIKIRYNEKVDFREYEARVKKLLDTHVGVEDVYVMNEAIDIFDEELREEEVLKSGGNPASLADTIAHKLKKTITERMDEDPVFNMKFSELIQEVINAFHEGRLQAAEFLKKVIDIRNEYKSGAENKMPLAIQDNPKARAFYGAVMKVLEEREDDNNHSEDKIAEGGVEIAKTVEQIATVDWKNNPNKPNEIADAIEDYLLIKQDALGVKLSFNEIDEIIRLSLKIAKANY